MAGCRGLQMVRVRPGPPAAARAEQRRRQRGRRRRRKRPSRRSCAKRRTRPGCSSGRTGSFAGPPHSYAKRTSQARTHPCSTPMGRSTHRFVIHPPNYDQRLPGRGRLHCERRRRLVDVRPTTRCRKQLSGRTSGGRLGGSLSLRKFMPAPPRRQPSRRPRHCPQVAVALVEPRCSA